MNNSEEKKNQNGFSEEKKTDFKLDKNTNENRNENENITKEKKIETSSENSRFNSQEDKSIDIEDKSLDSVKSEKDINTSNEDQKNNKGTEVITNKKNVKNTKGSGSIQIENNKKYSNGLKKGKNNLIINTKINPKINPIINKKVDGNLSDSDSDEGLHVTVKSRRKVSKASTKNDTIGNVSIIDTNNNINDKEENRKSLQDLTKEPLLTPEISVSFSNLNQAREATVNDSEDSYKNYKSATYLNSSHSFKDLPERSDLLSLKSKSANNSLANINILQNHLNPESRQHSAANLFSMNSSSSLGRDNSKPKLKRHSKYLSREDFQTMNTDDSLNINNPTNSSEYFSPTSSLIHSRASSILINPSDPGPSSSNRNLDSPKPKKSEPSISFAHGNMKNHVHFKELANRYPFLRAGLTLNQVCLLTDDIESLNDYGIEELRNGFFEATFLRNHSPLNVDQLLTEEASKHASGRWVYFDKDFIIFKFANFKKAVQNLIKFQDGIILLKAFIAYFIMYILCLISSIRHWLGPNYYLACIMTLLCHSGRSFGSQIELTFMCIIGGAIGLAWGNLGLYLSTCTSVATNNYGALLAASQILGIFVTSFIRGMYVRLYHASIFTALAIVFLSVVNNSATPNYHKNWEFAIPCLIGLAVALAVNIIIIPDFGYSSPMFTIHKSIKICLNILLTSDPNLNETHRLYRKNMELSETYRDMSSEIVFSRISPNDVKLIRNYLQDVIRSIRSIHVSNPFARTSNSLPVSRRTSFDGNSHPVNLNLNIEQPLSHSNSGRSTPLPFDFSTLFAGVSSTHELIRSTFDKPTHALLTGMCQVLYCCDKTIVKCAGMNRIINTDLPEILMNIALETTKHKIDISVSMSLDDSIAMLTEATNKYDTADKELIKSQMLTRKNFYNESILKIFKFLQPVRMSADKILAFSYLIRDVSFKNSGWRIHFPNYPLSKAFHRSPKQVIHDKGGQAASHYYYTNSSVEEIFRIEKKLNEKKRKHSHTSLRKVSSDSCSQRSNSIFDEQFRFTTSLFRAHKKEKVTSGNLQSIGAFRYNLWNIIHRLQMHETKFAIRATLATTLLSVPGWLEEYSSTWYDFYDCWWSVFFMIILMHARVGGNIQDLFTRITFTIIGSVWAALGVGARNGNGVVTAVFTAIFMIPALYRYTISPHPRSGVAACVSYTMVSLTCYSHVNDHFESVIQTAWPRGLTFLVGLLVSVVVSWILWPFVARRELRLSVSRLLSYISRSYLNVMSQYIYCDLNDTPSMLVVELSQILEGRMSSNFLSIRELCATTSHEPTVRGSFDQIPYYAILGCCERLFEALVEVRMSASFLKIYVSDGSIHATQALLPLRRDVVASLALTLFSLSSSFMTNSAVPIYLPSVLAARKRLLETIEYVDMANDDSNSDSKAPYNYWDDLFYYIRSSGLTSIGYEIDNIIALSGIILGNTSFRLKLD